jgi:uncharacterized protein (DUF58 family)
MKRAAGSAALGFVLLLAAATFAMKSLYVPGLTLLALGALFPAWVALAATGARLEREPGPPTVEEEARWPLRVTIKPGILPAPGGDLVEPLLPEPISLSRIPAGRGGVRRARVDVRFGRRGRRRLEPCRLTFRDPLGLAERELVGGKQRASVLVLPRIEPVLPVEGGGAPGSEGRGGEGADAQGGPRLPAPELELDVLRPYRQGTPATRIHWPTLARTGELVERRFVADPRARALVVVDAYEPVGERELDSAMRAAASLAYHLARTGGCGVLLPGDRRPTMLRSDMRSFADVHARLALLQPSRARPDAGSLRSVSGSVVWVTASDAIPVVPVAKSGGWVVAPHPLAAGAPVEFRVAGCIAQRLAAVWKEAA